MARSAPSTQSTSPTCSGPFAAAAATSASSTRFQFQLQPLDGVVGGILILPATAETVAGFIAASEAAPEELSTIANVMNCPPMPFVPEELHGSLVILGFLCYAGDAEAGEAAMAPFRALAEPIADMVKPISYPEMYPPEEGAEDYHPLVVGRTFFMDRVGRPRGRGDHPAPRGLGRSDARDPAARPRRRHGTRAGRCDRVRPSVQPDHGHLRRLPRGWRRPSSEAGVGGRLRERRSTRVARVPTSTSSRRTTRKECGAHIPARPGAAGSNEGPVRPGQPLPSQPQRRAGADADAHGRGPGADAHARGHPTDVRPLAPRDPVGRRAA